MIEIGNLKFDGIVLGPMAGVTDLPFRLLCKECGAGLIYTEMVSAKAITYHNKNTEDLLRIADEERPVALQLFGSEPLVMTEAVGMLEEMNIKADIIDINMGCPVPKVVNNGEGAALMKNPDLIEKLVKAATDGTKKPVSVKIRKGFEENEENATECALAAEAGGAKLVAVHGRTREDYYFGKADWGCIKRVKEAVKIPVIGNGDIYTPEDAKHMLEETNVDGIMVARGAQGNPWIFNRIRTYLETGKLLPEATLNERIEMALRHARMEIDFKGEYTGIREMRKHVAWYMAGFPGASKLRDKVNFIESYEELEKILNLYLH
ncbi:MAG: tRNA dihydrouridine synthase DusB [Lachnospiraceae bacterium]|nr:tRNA dihydrouridine synthase DusB [Lachnospiraceae bacterium]